MVGVAGVQFPSELVTIIGTEARAWFHRPPVTVNSMTKA